MLVMVTSRTDKEDIAVYALILCANILNLFVMAIGYFRNMNAFYHCQFNEALIADKPLLIIRF
jgi:hypothetical protein